jgi:sugar phosphate isomerase/epimerase
MSTERVAAITDEFSPADLDGALGGMAAVGMTGAELRIVFDRNMIDLTDEEIARALASLRAHGMTVVSLASPLLKCVLPDGPALDSRVQYDVFGSPHTFEDQPRLTRRAFEVAERIGAGIVRVFSYWRTVEPEQTFDRVAAALHELAEEASKRGMVIGLENEHACNVGTADETRRLLATIDHPALKIVWDPANAFILGETPYPDGYERLAADRIVHVHAKDCRVTGNKPTWGPIGEMDVDWRGQIRALSRDGYTGWFSLETHWTGPTGDKFEASTICGRNLRNLLSGEGAYPRNSL